MPTVARVQGFRMYFWSNEPNEPAHVHVDKADASAKVWLEPVSLASTAGFPAHELGVILRLVRARQTELMEAWREHIVAG